MKTLIYLSAFLMLSLFACKKDNPVAPITKTFGDYTRADIEAQLNNITTEAITYDAPAIANFKAGSIVFFKTTTAGSLGKMEVVAVDANYNLTVNLVIFDANNTKVLDKTAYVFALGNDGYDLDDPDLPVLVSADADFSWLLVNGYRSLYFGNGAKAYLFKP